VRLRRDGKWSLATMGTCMCSPPAVPQIIVEPASDVNVSGNGKNLLQMLSDKPKLPEVDHFSEAYQLDVGSDGILGHSSIGTVVKTRHKASSKIHAVKQISKRSIEGDEWQGELQALKVVDHPNICKVHDSWEDAMNIYMVMEFCRGGQLTGMGCSREEKVNESTVAVLVRQMVDAVSHLHKHRMVHSDIRPENWLFEEKLEEDKRPLDTQLKMVDFGFANKYAKLRNHSRFPNGNHLQVAQGAGAARTRVSGMNNEDRSLFCKAPEQVCPQVGSVRRLDVTPSEKEDVEKADVWALGIIAYFLLSGQPPFSGSPDALFRSASYVFMPTELWRPVSAEAKNFIAMCLQEAPQDRPRAEKALRLPWMGLANRALEEEAEMKRIGRWPPSGAYTATSKLSLLDPPLPSAERVKSTFGRMNQLNVMEKAAVIAAAHRLQEHKISGLFKAYEAMDKNQEGVITAQEFFDGLESCGVPCKELSMLIPGIDVNGSRMIEYPEFIAAIEDFQRNMQDSAVWAVFRNFDSQGGKAVLKQNLVEALGQKLSVNRLALNFPETKVESVLEQLDHDSRGVIEFEEFKQILKASGSASASSSMPFSDRVVGQVRM